MAGERAGDRRVVAAIIAGGRGRRFGGRVKALIEIDGVTILERLRAALLPQVDELVISANEAAPFAASGLRVVADAEPGAGPMAGVIACLEVTGAAWLLAVASDMPHVRGEVIELLAARATADVDAVAPVIDGHPEPLLALYAARALPLLRAELTAGRRSLSRVLSGDALRVARVSEAELRAVDPELACLTNVNRPEDLAGD